MTHTSAYAAIDWNEYARCYEAVRYLDAYRAMLETIIEAFPLKTHSTVFDAGCGTGNLTEMLASQSTSIALHAYDASPSMLAVAKQRCQGRGVNFKIHDLNETLPFQNGSVDVITSVNVLYALADPVHALAQWHRVLKKNGLVVFSTPKRNFEMGFILRAQMPESQKSASFWQGIGESLDREIDCVNEAFPDLVAREAIIKLARYNKHIVAAGRTKTFHFFSHSELAKLIDYCMWSHVTISETYANQNWLVQLTK